MGGGSIEVIHLRGGKMGGGDFPLSALAVCRQNERALACADQHPYAAHPFLLLPQGLQCATARPDSGECVSPPGESASTLPLPPTIRRLCCAGASPERPSRCQRLSPLAPTGSRASSRSSVAAGSQFGPWCIRRISLSPSPITLT